MKKAGPIPFIVLGLAIALIACNRQQPSAEGALTSAEARAIAKDAYIYGFPMAANYATMYKQAIDTTSEDYRAPFNKLTSAKSVATPDD